MSITLTAQDMIVLGKLNSRPSLQTSLTSSGWQPAERDLPAVDSMIERGILEKRPGFSSIQMTGAGYDAYADELDRQAERRDREGR